MDWLDNGKDCLPPPIECNLDPFAECNLACNFCVGQRYLRTHREEVGEMRKLPKEYMYRLVDFLATWGVSGLCLSGGGEPSLHDGVWQLPSYAVSKGMDVSFVTNGVDIHPVLRDNMMACRWVSFSVDAGNYETYKKIKGKDRFTEVINNIANIAALRRRTNAKVDLCYKMLILPENIDEIFYACRLARELGVQDFHVRPVDYERSDIEGHKKLDIDVEKVQEQFVKCHELETEEFRVFTIVHKFDPEFHIKHDFKKCYATLILPILTDGSGYLCVDKKMESRFRLGNAFPDPTEILKWWGSDKHREMIKSVNINECSRCTGSQYNKQIEQVVLQDKMCLAFP